MYPPRWLDAWPDAEPTSRLVFIVRNVAADVILAHFASGDPELSVKQGEP
jgi:hypothetical protein